MGIFAAVVSALFASAKDLVSKHLAGNIPSSLSAFTSFFFALPFYLVLLLVLYLAGVEDFAFSAAFFTYVILRSLTDSAAEWSKMHALEHGDISLISCFLSMSPLFLLITSPLITGDEIGPVGIIAVFVVVLAAAMLRYKPKQHVTVEETKGIAFALLAAVFFSLNACFDRLAVQVASPALSGFGMTLFSAVLIAPFALKGNWRGLAKINFKPLTLRGLLEVIFMVTKLFALQFMQAPYVAGIQKISLLFSIIGGKVIFKEEEFLKRFFAGVMIVIGVSMIIYAQLSEL